MVVSSGMSHRVSAPLDRNSSESCTNAARRFKQLEKENSRLKKLVAEMAIDNAILKEAAEGNF